MTDAATRARDAERVAMVLGWCTLSSEPGAVPNATVQQLAAMRDTVRSLAADARRLDWLDARKREDHGDYGYSDPSNSWTVYGRGAWSHNQKAPHGVENHPPHATVRDAIDAAMAAANARALADAFPVPAAQPDAGLTDA